MQFLGTKLTHCVMHNTMYNKYKEEKNCFKKKEGWQLFPEHIYWVFFYNIRAWRENQHSFLWEKGWHKHKKMSKLKKTQEKAANTTHTKDFKVEWMDFYGTMKSLLVKFTSVFLLGICFLEVLLLYIDILSFRDQDECKIIFFQKWLEEI